MDAKDQEIEALRRALRPFAAVGARLSPACANANLVDVIFEGDFGRDLLDAGDFHRAADVMADVGAETI